jgi:hypothetical protein
MHSSFSVFAETENGSFFYSGLIMKPHIAKKASKLLLQYQDIPPDIILQKCLLGELAECQECTNTLISSKRLLMHHIGYNASTSDERSYNKNEFQCGWRHPFVSSVRGLELISSHRTNLFLIIIN